VRIIVDQDEVLACLVKKVVTRWNNLNGTNFSREHVNMWRMEDVFGKSKDGISAEVLIDQWMSEKGFFEDLEPIDAAIEGFNTLRKTGHDVVIATSVPERYVNSFDDKRKWVRRYFPDFSMKSFIACSRKGLLEGDVLLDDGSHNLTDWTQNYRSGGIIFDAPWNQEINETINGVPVARAYDWPHAIRIIEEIAKEKYENRMRAEHGIFS
jgi:5'(3')-deoxyribonucleotidase